MRERALAARAATSRGPTTGRGSTSRRSTVARRATRDRASKRFIAPDDGNAERRDGDGGAAAASRSTPGGSGRDSRSTWTRARAAHVRAHRRDRQLLLHRAVVPEARRAAGRGLELPSVSRRHRVLLRLRRLRRVADGARAAGRSARPASSASAATTPTAPTTHRYYQEDVHDFAWTTSPDYLERTARFEHPRPAAGRDAAAAAARARRAGGAAFRRDAHDAEVLRRVVRRVSVRPHHDRRSRVPERRRRHGVPDAVHRRHALARAGARHDARRR